MTSANRAWRLEGVSILLLAGTAAAFGLTRRLPTLTQPPASGLAPSYAIKIDLWNTCQAFKSGHRIRLEIASSAFPKYDRNLNTGDVLGQSTRMRTANQKIYHDRKYASHLVLPIIPKKP